MVLRRDDWLDLARKVDWTPRYVEERELFPEEISGRPWLTHDAWHGWNEAYRTTYREYVANQRERGALGPARAALGGRRRGRHAVLRAARAVQPVPAPRAVHPARAEHGLHLGDGRTPLSV